MRRIIFMTGVLFCSITANAQLATLSDSHLRVIGARALGMGGAYTAVADDASAAHWNPGALGLLRKTSVTGGFWLQQNWATFEKGNYSYFRDGTQTANPMKFGLNDLSLAVPIAIGDDFRITPVLSYREYYNYRGFKESWEINHYDANSGTSMKETVEYDNTGGVNAISTGFGITIGEHSAVGLVMNTLTGKRDNTLKYSNSIGGSSSSTTNSSFYGRTWNFGWKYSTLTFEEQENREDNSDLNGFEMGVSVVVPEYRKSDVTTGSAKTTYFVNDGPSIRGGIAAIFNGNVFTFDVGHSSFKNNNQMLFQGTNAGYMNLPADIKITHVAAGIESLSILRAGFMFKNYQIKMTETKEQPWTPSIMGGLSFSGIVFSLDITAQFEFFKWTKAVTYNNGTQGIDYNGTGFSLFTTGRFRF